MERHILELMLLFGAVRDGNVGEVRQLVRSVGANPNDDTLGHTPLHLASLHGRLAVARYLVEEVQVNVESRTRDGGGMTPLHVSCARGHLHMVRYLIETGGANFEAQTGTGHRPLHFASRGGHTDIVTYLVEDRHADIFAKSSDRDTPQDIAFSNGKVHIVRYLFPRMPTVDDRTLYRAWQQDMPWDIMNAVLEKYAIGCGSLLADAFHRNPICTILKEFPLPSVRAFQDCIQNFPPSALSLLDDQGRLAIHVALSSSNASVKSPEVVELLLEREPRSVVARDQSTGLYPYEIAAGLVMSNDDDAENEWLNVVYKLFRCNPSHVLRNRTTDGCSATPIIGVPDVS